jgi:hypothetical protein
VSSIAHGPLTGPFCQLINIPHCMSQTRAVYVGSGARADKRTILHSLYTLRSHADWVVGQPVLWVGFVVAVLLLLLYAGYLHLYA